MAFQEAYKVESEGMKLNENAFTEGRSLETALVSKIDEVQSRLEEMQATMAEDLGGDQLKVVSRAVKQELADGIPENFKGEYEATTDGNEAAALISKHILEEVNSFITNKLKGVIEMASDSTISSEEASALLDHFNKKV